MILQGVSWIKKAQVALVIFLDEVSSLGIARNKLV